MSRVRTKLMGVLRFGRYSETCLHCVPFSCSTFGAAVQICSDDAQPLLRVDCAASLMQCLLRITPSCSVKLLAGHVQEIGFQHTPQGMQGCKPWKGVCVFLLGISIAIFPTMRRAIGCIDGAAQAIWEEPPWRDCSKEAS